jgi:hypothetical protein
LADTHEDWSLVHDPISFHFMWIPSSNLVPVPAAPSTRSAHERALLDTKLATDVHLSGYAAAHADLRCVHLSSPRLLTRGSVYTNHWLEVAVRLLRAIRSNPRARLTLVTTSHVCLFCLRSSLMGFQLVATYAKLIVFKLSEFFDVPCIFSARVSGSPALLRHHCSVITMPILHAGKEACFQAIRSIYGPSVQYLVVGDGYVHRASMCWC